MDKKNGGESICWLIKKNVIRKKIKNTYKSIINSAASLNQIIVKISIHVNMTVKFQTR